MLRSKLPKSTRLLLATGSKHIPERRGLIPKITHFSTTPHVTILPVPLLINPRITCSQHNKSYQPDRDKSNLKSMPKNILRFVGSSVEVARHSSCKIANSNMNGYPCRSFVGACKIVRHPGDISREGRIDSTGGDEYSSVD